MKYCRFHPSEAASYHCPTCHYHACHQCTDEGDGHSADEGLCFVCKSPLDFLGAAYTAEPFWRRLGDAFRYPLASEPISVLLIAATISLVGLYIPLLNILAAAFLYKYCFACLEATAHGKNKAPNVTVATSGGIQLLLHIIGILVLGLGSIILIANFIGWLPASLWAVFVSIALPAAFMILAINKDFSQAINPSKQLELMSAIGPAYFLLLLLLFVMMSSVGLLQYIIGDNFSSIGQFSSLLISNYYAIVMFNVMGYAVFQYQDKLGISADVDDGKTKRRTDKQRLKAKVGIFLKEGNYYGASNLYHSYLDKYPQDNEINDRLFNLLTGINADAALIKFADQYLTQLFTSEQHFKISSSYKQLLQCSPEYKPNSPNLRLKLAQQLYQLGDFKKAALLLKDFHKQSSSEKLTIEAYSLMIDCLDKLPGTEAQQKQYQLFVEKLSSKQLQAN